MRQLQSSARVRHVRPARGYLEFSGLMFRVLGFRVLGLGDV